METAQKAATSGAGEARVEALLQAIGERVRAARAAAGLSRRELSERSGLSQRYIAQLESGQGNISVGLLVRVADALSLRLDRLVAGEADWPSEAEEIAELWASASDAQRAAVVKILKPEAGDARRANRIALIGLRGAGKSTVGRMVAETLALPFIELNDEIAGESGMAANEVIALYGPEGYRHLERAALERVAAAHNTAIVAVAGGIATNPASFDYLLGHYHTIWLKAAPEEHMARVRAQGDERPMAGRVDAMGALREILTSREQIYARAGFCVDTSGRTLAESYRDVLAAIRFIAATPVEGDDGWAGPLAAGVPD